MEIIAEILGPLNMKAGNLAIEAGFFVAAFLFLSGVAIFLNPARAASGSIWMAAGMMLGFTIFFFVQGDKNGHFFGAANVLLPLLLSIAGGLAGILLAKYSTRPTFVKRLHKFNLVAGIIGLLICLTGFARTHHNAVLISALGVLFGLLAATGSWIIIRQKPGRRVQTKFFQAQATPGLLLFFSSLSLSLTGYIVVSTPMILISITVAAMGLSSSIMRSTERDSRLRDVLHKRITT